MPIASAAAPGLVAARAVTLIPGARCPVLGRVIFLLSMRCWEKLTKFAGAFAKLPSGYRLTQELARVHTKIDIEFAENLIGLISTVLLTLPRSSFLTSATK
jgi:hypothetical protein